MTRYHLHIPPDGPDQLEAVEVAHPTRSWPRLHAVLDLVNSWRRPAAVDTGEPVQDIEGRVFLVEGPTFLGRAERIARTMLGEPAPDLVRLTLRGFARPLDVVFLPGEADRLADQLHAGADAARAAAATDAQAG